MDETRRRVVDQVEGRPGKLIVTQGFIGSTARGVTTTLGRGGSDYSATILGNILKAEEVQIWTDVHGIMTCDPRIVPDAVSITSISYDEAAELAYFGAKVVHPFTIQPAVEQGIPVFVKNTKDPEHPGTRIDADSPATGVRALAMKRRITLVTVQSSRMLNAWGFLKRLFAVFADHKLSVDLVATSEVSVSVSIDDATVPRRLVKDLEALGDVAIAKDMSILCLVGRNLWKESKTLARVFRSIEGCAVRMISLGSSDINLSLVVGDDEAESAMKRLHNEFFETVASSSDGV